MHNNYSDPPSPGHAELFTRQWRITSVCLLAFLGISFLILCYYIRHLCHQEQRNRRVSAAIASSIGDGDGILNDKLGPEVLASIPIFVYDAILGQQEKLECAIYLTEFREGEKGRLLPRCGHRFHVECVDMWLETHFSCPLCRVVVVKLEYVDESAA